MGWLLTGTGFLFRMIECPGIGSWRWFCNLVNMLKTPTKLYPFLSVNFMGYFNKKIIWQKNHLWGVIPRFQGGLILPLEFWKLCGFNEDTIFAERKYALPPSPIGVPSLSITPRARKPGGLGIWICCLLPEPGSLMASPPRAFVTTVFPPCCGLKCVSQKDIFKSRFLGSVNLTLFGNRVFTEVIKVKWGHPGLGWALIHWPVSLEEVQFGHINMHGGKTTWRHMGMISCDGGCRDGSAAVMSQSMPRIAGGYQKLEQARRDVPLQVSGEHGPANVLILNFSPPELWEDCSIVLRHSLCDNLLWSSYETNTRL